MNLSRRNILRAAGSLSVVGAGTLSSRLLTPFSASLAAMAGLASQATNAAGTGSDYRALVCLFMAGGNDSHNWVVPIDTAGYGDYVRARSNLALPMSSLEPLSRAPSQAAGRQFAFASDLAPLRTLYESGKLAVVANVGPLVQPTTKAQYEAGIELPSKLFSHNDQQSNWQAMAAEGARAGWGGRIADVLMTMNDTPIFTTVSAAGNAVFLSGLNATQYRIGTEGAVGIGGMNDRYTLGSSEVAAALRQTQLVSGSNPFETEHSRVVKRSAEAYAALNSAMGRTNVATIENNPSRLSNGTTLILQQEPLAKQLQAVARMAAANQALGMRRQIFMVSIGGFDTHANQFRDQPTLSAKVAQSISYFMSSIDQMGLANNVTLFTASDFGRTLTSNGSGSDHGWGSHHVVAGGAVRGGDIYGRFPITALGSADDVGSGRLLPSTSVTEYAATLATWMGVPASDLASVLPGASLFDTGALRYL